MRTLALLVGLVAAAASPSAAPARHAKPAPPLASQDVDVEPLAIVGGTIHPVVGPDVALGTLVLSGGRIRAILPAGHEPPAGTRTIDARGRHVYPGLVAASANGLGLVGDAFTGGADAILGRPVADGFDAWASEVELAVSGGTTTAVVWAMAGQPKGPLAGRAAVLKMSAREPRGVVVKDPAAVAGSSLLLGSQGRRDLRETLEKLRKSHASPPARDAPKDALRELSQGRIPLVMPVESAGDVLTALEVARELDVPLVVEHATEAWAVAAQIHEAGASVVQGVRNSWGTPRADRRASLPGGWTFDAVTRLHDAGVPTATCPVSDVIRLWGVGGRDLLDLPIEAAFAQRGGLSAQAALESVTIVPARIFGVDDRVGSLEVGKDADVLVTDGDLLDYRTFVRLAIVGGRVAYDASTSRHWKSIVLARDRAIASGSAHPSGGGP